MKYKKILRSLLAVVMTVCLSGCLRVSVDINVKKNGKADVSILYATVDMSSMTSDGSSLGLTPEQVEEYRGEGWDVTDYKEDEYAGYILSQKDMDLTKADFVEAGEGTVKKEGSLYIVDLLLFSEEDQTNLKTYGSLIKSAGGYFNVRVTLPVKPEKHNATSVSEDGKTLEWDVLEMEAGEPVHLEVKLPNIMIYIILGLAVVAAIAAFFLFKKNSGKEKTIPESVPVQEVKEEIPEEKAEPVNTDVVTEEKAEPVNTDEAPAPETPSEEKTEQ